MSDWRSLDDAIDGTVILLLKGDMVKKPTATGGWCFIAVLDARPLKVDIHAGAAAVSTTSASAAILRGAIEAVKWATERSYWHVIITTDDDLLFSGVNNWMKGWRKRDWRKADGTSLANADLWKELDVAMQKTGVTAVMANATRNRPTGRLLWAAAEDIALCAAEAEAADKPLPSGWELKIWEKNYADRAAHR